MNLGESARHFHLGRTLRGEGEDKVGIKEEQGATEVEETWEVD